MGNKIGTNFLLIVNLFPPIFNQNSIRALEITKNLAKDYLNPIILTQKITARDPQNPLLYKQVPKNLKIYRTPILEVKYKYGLKNAIRKFFNFFFGAFNYIYWIPFGYLIGKRIYKKDTKYNFIFATGPPFWSHIIAYLLHLKFHVPIVVEYRDPWTQLSYDEVKSKVSLMEKKIQSIIQKRILNSTEMVITISSALKSFLISKFPIIRHKLIFSVPNGLNLNVLPPFTKKNKNKVIFTFTGQLYGKRTGIPLLKIISDLKKEGFFTKIDFSLKIFGLYQQNKLEKLLTTLDIKDLVYLGGFISQEMAFEEINQCDLAIHIGENIDYPTIAIKVWDYLSCRKKILYVGLEDSFTAKFLSENDLGIVIPINNMSKGKEKMKSIIRMILKEELENIIEIKKLENYLWETRIRKLEYSFTRMLNKDK